MNERESEREEEPGRSPGSERDGPGSRAAELEQLTAHLVRWIRDAVTGSGAHGVVFGLSGGLDSALVASLAVRAFPQASLGVIMPCHSDPRDEADARLIAERVGLAVVRVDLSPVYDRLLEQLTGAEPRVADSRLALANVKPRLRMITLYAFANLHGYRVLGTGNRSELAVGYFTKYGDGGVDFLPLGSLTKTEVRELSRHLHVPATLIDKPPSAGLWAGQTDEQEMGLTYEELDAYLLGSGTIRAEVAERIDGLVAGSRHKRELPQIAPLPTTWPAPGPGGRGQTPGAAGRPGAGTGPDPATAAQGGAGGGTRPRAGG